MADGMIPLPSAANQRTLLRVLKYLAAAIGFATLCQEAKSANSFWIEIEGRSIRFDCYVPKKQKLGKILLLVPPCNAPGESMISPEWINFANRYNLILLAPTFQITLSELKDKRGYYYPRQWSGAVVEEALNKLPLQVTGSVSKTKILVFGFSAGAHFAHRFALWAPDRVEAFVAGAAGWWDAPTQALRKIPALVLCGENDFRLEASEQFFYEGLALNLPWIWRSYPSVGHEMTPAMYALAQAFLAHYAQGEVEQDLYGDVQTYDVWRNPDRIPEAVRVKLPSEEIAKAWQREK